jgi:hypothetical protein
LGQFLGNLAIPAVERKERDEAFLVRLAEDL